MSILDKIEAEGQKALTWTEHAANWLVGRIAQGSASLHSLEASSPYVAEAIGAGLAKAQAAGIPVGAFENAGEAVLAAAKAMAANLSVPTGPVPPSTPAADPASPSGS